jgi:hypothetical protein
LRRRYGIAEYTEDAEETTMLALVVAALVPTVVMTAALSLERLERCVLRQAPLDRGTSTAAVTRSLGDGNTAAPVVPEPEPVDQR